MAVAFTCGIALAQDTGNGTMGSSQSQQSGSMGGAQGGVQSSTYTHTAKNMPKFTGTVQSVDPANMKLSAQDSKGNTMNFSVPSTAKIHKGKQTINLSNINPGDKVTVAYTGTATNPVAQSIRVSGTTAPSTGTSQGGTKGTTGTSQGGTSGSGSGY